MQEGRDKNCRFDMSCWWVDIDVIEFGTFVNANLSMLFACFVGIVAQGKENLARDRRRGFRHRFLKVSIWDLGLPGSGTAKLAKRLERAELCGSLAWSSLFPFGFCFAVSVHLFEVDKETSAVFLPSSQHFDPKKATPKRSQLVQTSSWLIKLHWSYWFNYNNILIYILIMWDLKVWLLLTWSSRGLAASVSC